LGSLDVQSTKTLIGLAADVTLLLDQNGKIVDVSAIDGERLTEESRGWVGKDWQGTVAAESRSRIVSMLRDAGEGATRWIQVKHPSSRGIDIPVQYRAMTIDPSGHVLAVGRDLQAMASLQQQLVDAQQALERDYWRYREMETRYRLLFRMVSEGTLVIEASTLRVIESNPAADRLLGRGEHGVVGRSVVECFDKPGTARVRELLSRLSPGGPADEVQATCAKDGRTLKVSASLVRQGSTSIYLLRITPEAAVAPTAEAGQSAAIFDKAIRRAPDCILITDHEGHLLAANPAFFDLAQIPPTHAVKGELLERWVGRSGIDLRVLISNLEKYGILRLFRTTFRSEIGTTSEVEISAATVEDDRDHRSHLGFFIRDIGRRLSRETLSEQDLPVWLDELTERIGSAPLKELVRESTERIERLCIEAALKLTGDNRASAAELLGLSRQSLYVKLARYGLGPSAPEDAD
jgi:transcriptional regulator PpsR